MHAAPGLFPWSMKLSAFNLQVVSLHLPNGVTRDGFCLYFRNLSKITQHLHAMSGLFSWSMELLAYASRQFGPKIVLYFLPCELALRAVGCSLYTGIPGILRVYLVPGTPGMYVVRTECALWSTPGIKVK